MQNGFTIRARQVANRAGLALLGLALALPAAHAQSQWFGFQKPGTPADQQPLILKKINIQQKLGTQLPLNLEFTDETGKAVHLGDYFGKRPVILSLVYYQCKIL